MELHIDTGKIFKHEETGEGFLRLYATVARTGPLVYRNDDGSTRIEIVTKEELFKTISLDSASMKPITVLHPTEGRVTPENARRHVRGFTSQKVLIDGDFLTVVGTILDAEAIANIKNGTVRQMSAGYTVNTHALSDGTFEQRDRIYNHFSLVPEGRAGADVCVHVDAGDASQKQSFESWICNDVIDNSYASEQQMTRQIIIDDVGYSISDPGLETAIAGLKSRVSNLQKSLNTKSEEASKSLDSATNFKTKLDVLTSQLNTLSQEKSRVDGELVAANTKLEQASSNRLDEAEVQRRVDSVIATRIEETLDLWSLILPTLRKDAPDYKPDYKLTPNEIRKLYLAKVAPQVKLDASDDSFVTGLWTGLRPDRKDATRDAIDKTRSHLDRVIENTHIDTLDELDETSAIDKARAEAVAEIEGAWKK